MRDRIAVDLLNPGQVFACIGIAEIAERLFGFVEAGFDGAGATAAFEIEINVDESPVAAVLAFLRTLEVRTEAPAGSDLSTSEWGVPTVHRDDDRFPFPLPRSLATLPAIVTGLHHGESVAWRIESWGDDRGYGRDNLKFWAGAAGMPGATFLLNQLKDVRAAPTELPTAFFDYATPQSASFRFDWRKDTISIHSGFAINSHVNIITVGFPFVEVLALFGVSHARPRIFDGKLHYRYGVMTGGLWSLPMLRLALGAPSTVLPIRVFDMILDWPGQKDQARCIVDAREIADTKEMTDV